MGPNFDFKVRRRQEADPDMLKASLRRPKVEKRDVEKGLGKKRKNVETDDMGDKVGRIHLGKQEFGKLQYVFQLPRGDERFALVSDLYPFDLFSPCPIIRPLVPQSPKDEGSAEASEREGDRRRVEQWRWRRQEEAFSSLKGGVEARPTCVFNDSSLTCFSTIKIDWSGRGVGR